MVPNSSVGSRGRQPVACSVCNLSKICIPSGMQEDEIESLSSLVKRDRTIQKNETIYHAGDRFTGIYALKSGSAKLVHTDRNGFESIIAILLPGEILGFDGLSSGRYLCSLMALEPSSYCELPSQDLEQRAQKTPAIQQAMLQRAGEQFDQCIERIAVSQRSAEERLAKFLMDLSRRFHVRGFHADHFRLSLTRQEMGNHLGLALETVSRLLSRLEQLGLISVRGKQIKILNFDGLLKICGESLDPVAIERDLTRIKQDNLLP